MPLVRGWVSWQDSGCCQRALGQLMSYAPQMSLPTPPRKRYSLSCSLSTWSHTPLLWAWFCTDCLTKPSCELTPGVWSHYPELYPSEAPLRSGLFSPLSGARPSLDTAWCLSFCPPYTVLRRRLLLGIPPKLLSVSPQVCSRFQCFSKQLKFANK